jgi:hypothetical protein
LPETLKTIGTSRYPTQKAIGRSIRDLTEFLHFYQENPIEGCLPSPKMNTDGKRSSHTCDDYLKMEKSNT